MQVSNCPYCGAQPKISYHPVPYGGGCWHIACKNEECVEKPSTWFYYAMGDAKDEWEAIVNDARADKCS